MEYGFVWNIDPALLKLGTLEIRYYGIFFVCAVLTGYLYIVKYFRKNNITEQTADSLLFWGILSVIIGTRLAHCFFYEPQYYFNNPFEIIKVWKGGLASHGAAIGLITMAIIFSLLKKIPVLVIFDSISFAAASGAAFVRIGNFFNSEIIGRITDVSWGVKFLRNQSDFAIASESAAGVCNIRHLDCLITHWPLRHPSQIYEAIGGFLILLMLIIINKRMKNISPGFLSGIFLATYFPFRFFVEFFKEYQILHDGLTMGQWLSIPFVAAGILLIFKREYLFRIDPSYQHFISLQQQREVKEKRKLRSNGKL